MKIKLAFLISTLNTGGAEKQLVNTVNNLPLDRYEIKIFVLKDKLKIANQLNEGIDIIVLKVDSYINPIQLQSALKKIHLYNPEIIHSVMFASNLIARFYKLTYGDVKIINHIHGLGSWIRPRHIWLDRMFTKWVDKILVVSQKSKKIRLEREQYSEKKLDILYNSMNVNSFFLNQNINGKGVKIKIGIAGRLIKLKQMNVAIETVIKLNKRGKAVVLEIAGTGPEMENLKQLVKENQAEEFINFRGFVEDMAGFFQSIDCFILCSTTEDMPLTIIEAFAAGLPVIAPNIGGIPELFNNTIGLLVNDFDEDLDKIESFLDQVDLESAKKINNQFAKENFDIDIHISKLVSIYGELVEQ